MNLKLAEQIKELMKENVIFEFKNMETSNDFLILTISAKFFKNPFEFAYIARGYAGDYLVCLNDSNVIISGFDQIEHYFLTIISEIEGNDKLKERLQYRDSRSFVSDAVAELLKKMFKESKMYKMHCLYDKNIENLIK